MIPAFHLFCFRVLQFVATWNGILYKTLNHFLLLLFVLFNFKTDEAYQARRFTSSWV